MSNGKSLKVSILGKSYSLVTDENEELVMRSASTLDSMLQQVVGSAEAPLEAIKKTTFVALQLAVELEKKRQELEAINHRTHELNSLLKDTLNRSF